TRRWSWARRCARGGGGSGGLAVDLRAGARVRARRSDERRLPRWLRRARSRRSIIGWSPLGGSSGARKKGRERDDHRAEDHQDEGRNRAGSHRTYPTEVVTTTGSVAPEMSAVERD